MQPVSHGAKHYDFVTIMFHWLTALLVLTQWFGAQTIDWFPRGALRIDARSVHITCGVLLAVVIAARIVWRLTGGRQLEPADRGILALVSKATHWALYALVVAMLLVGLLLTWARGDTIFNLFKLPAMVPSNHDLADQIQDVHATIGWMILGLAGVHAAAALFHRFVWKDGVLARMFFDREPMT